MEAGRLHLDKIVERIERAFGKPLPYSNQPVAAQESEVIERVLGDDGYQVYLQDQVNRQVIRSYLANAIVLGILPEERLVAFAAQLATSETRAALSLHMLMSSVEEANALVPGDAPEVLQPLRPAPGSPPHMKLVPS